MGSVAVDILTGFLGSGKTTLLRHVLTHGLRGKRVAVVMNELGDIGIDGRVVTGLDAVERMVELSNGCICCSIDEYRFDLAIQELVATARPDVVVVESTGLADPDPMAYRVRGAGLRVDAVTAVVDVANLERCLDEAEVVRRQIEAADFLVLSKTDLVEAHAVERVARRLRRLNGRALQLRAAHGVVDADILFATGVAAYRERGGPHTSDHLARDAYGSCSYRSRHALDQARFERALATLPADVIRAKGLVRLHGREWHCLFNVTCGRVETSWLKLPGGSDESQAVFIGRAIDRHRPALLAALRRCEVR